ncbi:general stress protein [Sinosporangium siamense]|uniref:Membrane protein n=1 Tax=Sinosporangium siamense TaxID=1367973 RepID=A0A919RKX7_9ACTN|nr:general stress protein [Sinosporangium siamense]GII93971.1 membrane protein [Sinosporangium siamense]
MALPASASGSPAAGYTPVAVYTDYLRAQKAVDYLSDNHFPVDRTAIVGSGLKLMEKVLGRMTPAKALGRGAIAGAWFGLLIGLFLAIFSTRAGTAGIVILWGLIWGLIAGALFGVVSHLLTKGQRDFVAVSQVVADRYEVLVDPEHAERAREMLQAGGVSGGM